MHYTTSEGTKLQVHMYMHVQPAMLAQHDAHALT